LLGKPHGVQLIRLHPVSDLRRDQRRLNTSTSVHEKFATEPGKSAEQGRLDRQVVEPVHVPAGIRAFEKKRGVTGFHDRSVEAPRTKVQ